MVYLDKETMEDLWKTDIPGNFPVLLTVENPDIFWTEEEKAVFGQEDGQINFVSDNIKVKYMNKTWLPCAFSFTPPEKSGSKSSTASISISAIDARVRKLLGIMKVESTISIVALYSKQLRDDGKYFFKFKKLESNVFKLKSVSCSKTVASFNLTPNIDLQQNVPYDTALRNRVPAAGQE